MKNLQINNHVTNTLLTKRGSTGRINNIVSSFCQTGKEGKKRMAKGLPTISQLPSGKYHAQYIPKDSEGHTLKDENGKRKVISVTRDTEQEVMRELCRLIGQETTVKGYTDVSRYEALNLTVGEAIEQYIDDNEKRLRPATVNGYWTAYRTRLQSIMNIPIGSLKPVDVQRAVNEDYERLSRKSIKEAVALLKRVLVLNDIPFNFKAVRIPKDYKPKKVLPGVSEVMQEFVGTPYELACLLAMWCSMRVSEVRGLKYSDITTKGDTHYITIQRTNVCIHGIDYLEEKTKTEQSTRTNILPDYLYKLIMSQPHKSSDDFIVGLSYRALYAAVKRKMSSVGYNMTFHDLRHIFATTLNDLGVNSDYAQKIGGWANPTVMKSVYTHTTDAKEKEYQSQIDSYYEGIIAAL